MVEVHLYGNLRRLVPHCGPTGGCALRVPLEEGETVGQLLARLGIPADQVYHAFLNGKLFWTRNSMAPYLGYQQVEDGRVRREPALERPLKPHDRLGLFGRDMALLVV
ncbi:MAG: hypothetical protein H5T59_05190, partial [Anaerolineae bacterium]|nr:hypothetical protein [Anaerolineae bacterium]